MDKHEHVRDGNRLCPGWEAHLPNHQHYVTPGGGVIPLAMPGFGVHTHRLSGDWTTDTLMILEPSEVFL